MADGSRNHGALTGIDPNRFLPMLHQGFSLSDIAKKVGVSRQAIHAWMLREGGEQYHEAITAALVQRVADADEALQSASDPVDIARAREMARFARMDLERRRPALYGQRQQITHEVGPDLGDLLRDARKRVSQQQHNPGSSAAAAIDNCRIIDTTAEVVKDSGT